MDSQSMLTGEVISLTHLVHLPALMKIHGDIEVEVKYVGGFQAILHFQSTVDMKKFMENKNNWKDSLKWLKKGENTKSIFERLTCIRIVGLPLK